MSVVSQGVAYTKAKSTANSSTSPRKTSGNPTYSIGLTGGIGSGKSTVANLFRQFDIDIVDTDLIAKDVVRAGQPVLLNISERFGAKALLDNGELNRKYMRKVVFENPELKAWLNAQLHPLIRKEMLLQIENAVSTYVLVDVPLLTENNMASLFDRILVVDCSEQTQITRAVSRDGASKSAIQNIISAQANRTQRLAIANDVIVNESDMAHLQTEVSILHQQYTALSNNVK